MGLEGNSTDKLPPDINRLYAIEYLKKIISLKRRMEYFKYLNDLDQIQKMDIEFYYFIIKKEMTTKHEFLSKDSLHYVFYEEYKSDKNQFSYIIGKGDRKYFFGKNGIFKRLEDAQLISITSYPLSPKKTHKKKLKAKLLHVAMPFRNGLNHKDEEWSDNYNHQLSIMLLESYLYHTDKHMFTSVITEEEENSIYHFTQEELKDMFDYCLQSLNFPSIDSLHYIYNHNYAQELSEVSKLKSMVVKKDGNSPKK